MFHFSFDALYKKYHDEVHPARLVFVSFLRHQHSKGHMVSKLQAKGFNPMQFKLDGSRPDLTKLDTLFGLLSSDTSTFEEQLKEMETEMNTTGMQAIFEALALHDSEQQAESH